MKRPTKSNRRTREEANSDAWGVSSKTQKASSKKEQWNQTNGLHSFSLTKSQQELSSKIDNNDLVFAIGSAGSGKTTAVLHNFVREYLQDSKKQIIIVRTPVESGLDKIGALPNDYNAKVEPHFASSKLILEQLMSKGKVETDLDHRIHFKIPNYMLGSTFTDALILVDEAQMLPPLILKLILERTGVGSKVVVAGDNSQLYTDARGRNALRDAIPRFFTVEDSQYVCNYPYVSIHEFDVEDVQRSDLVKSVIRAYGSEL